MNSIRLHAGFTLVELLLSVALMTVLLGISMPVYRTLYVDNDLEIIASITTDTLRRAQVLSYANEGNSSWGVHVSSDSIILFKGSSYAARDASFDEISTLSAGTTPSGITDIVFTRLSGLPQTTGSITLTTNSGSKTISINTKGMVEY